MAEPNGEGPRRRRRLRIRLRTLMLLVLVVGVPLGWKVDRARTQRRAVAAIRKNCGYVTYDYIFSGKYPYEIYATPRGPAWLRRWIGDEYFQEVTAVTLGDNATDGSLAALGDLDRLLACELHGTKVTEAGLRHLERARSLRIIWLYNTAITDADLGRLAGMPRLERLKLFQVEGLTGAGLAQLTKATGLRELSLSATDISGAGLKPLESMTGLRTLDLQFSQVDDAGLAPLAGLTGLRELDLGNSRIGDEGLEHLRPLVRLEVLRLGFNVDITDAGLGRLEGMKDLRELDLSGTMVTDAGLAHLAGMRRLRDLDLTSDEITDAGLVHLRGLHSLGKLDLSGTWVSAGGRASLRKANTTLEISGWVRPRHLPSPARQIRELREERRRTAEYAKQFKEWHQARERGEDRPSPKPPS